MSKKMMMPSDSRFMAAAKEDVLEMFLYGQIGKNMMGEGIDSSHVAAALRANNKPGRISLRINSPGGSVAQGSAIYSLLASSGKPVDVFVDGFACSAAFTVAMAGDTISIGEAGRMMLHNAWGMCIGESGEMLEEAKRLDDLSSQMAGIYAKRSGLDLAEVKSMMDAETWLSPEKAVEKGFAGRIIKSSAGHTAKAEAAKWDMSAFAKNLPQDLKAQKDESCQCPCPSCAVSDCASCSVADCSYDGCDHDEDPDMKTVVKTVAPNFSMYERRLRLAELNK